MQKSIVGIILVLLLTSISAVAYEATESMSVVKVADLDDSVSETSGMLNLDGRLFTHNDSGGDAAIYEINSTTGNVVRTVSVEGASNVDWEDLASDDTHVYIADIGNNDGSRDNLKIYKILKSDLLLFEIVSAEVINVSYADQTQYSYDPYTTPYDAEALIAFNENLYIFTKSWADYTTRVYAVPTVAGSYDVPSIDEKKLDVLVTGATIDPATQLVALIGYSYSSTELNSSIILLSDFAGDSFFSGNVLTNTIENSLDAWQVESIVFKGEKELYLSAEEMIWPLVRPAVLHEASIVYPQQPVKSHVPLLYLLLL